MDRCALFVDASYVLADGAMAVHGTRRRDSVSWDYAGLVQLLGGMAREQSGLPLLRCYWYEATVEGRRSEEHEALADLPGVKLRLAKMRPGRREGVEGEIHRDLTTLARNKAVSDAVVISAEEDLAQVVADAQDLGMRVTLLHVAFDGNGTVPRALRQECDDIAEIGSAHLRPYVELISGAEPPRADERDGAPVFALRQAVNGHTDEDQRSAPQLPPFRLEDLATSRPVAPAALPAATAGMPSEQSDRPDLAARQRDPQPAQQQPQTFQQEGQPALMDARLGRQEPSRQEAGAEPDQAVMTQEPMAASAPQYLGAPPELAVVQPEPARVQPAPQHAARSDLAARADSAPRQEMYGGPVAVPAPAADQRVARPPVAADISGYSPGAMREQPPLSPVTREPLPVAPGGGFQSAPGSAQIHRLPVRGTGPQAVVPPMPPVASTAAHPMPAPPGIMQPAAGTPGSRRLESGQPEPGRHHSGPLADPWSVQHDGGQPPAPGMAPGAGHAVARNGSYSGPMALAGPSGLVAPPGVPQPGPGGQAGPGFGGPAMPSQAMPPQAASQAGPMNGVGPNAFGPAQGGFGGQGAAGGPVGPSGPGYHGGQPGVSLADALQSAHQEGQAFGESVARDAPALWLEAVLARKPRMPSDLEARLLQGSALPIDFLLHDEVRHALRRGFWDALERARR